MTHGRAARAAAGMGFTSDDVIYSAMPLFHGNALSAAVLPALAGGATLALRRRFSASGLLDDVRSSGATYFNTVGRAISHLVATPPTEHDRDHRLRFVLGPETSATDKAEFTRRFGVPLFEGYGSSENADHPAAGRPGPDPVLSAGPVTGTTWPWSTPPPARSGRRAVFDADGRLVNPAEAIGELVGRAALSNFEGYYNNPEAEAERTRNGWYWSGDLAYRDEEGVFYFAGRTGDWLRVDSENFAAAPVERILGRFPGFRGVAVFPVPDPRTGDQVMAAAGTGGGRPLRSVGLRRLPGRPARPGHQVGAALRAHRHLPAGHGHRQGRQAAAPIGPVGDIGPGLAPGGPE